MLFHRTANLKIERLNLGLQRSDRRKKHLQDESVMIRKEALNGFKKPVSALLVIAHRINILLAQPRQITPLAYILRRNKTALQKTMTQQSGNPLAVPNVRLTPGYVMHIPCICQNHSNRILQYVMHRPPVNPRTFHRHHRTFMLRKPVTQTNQIVREGTEYLDIGLLFPLVVRENNTGRNAFLVNIQSATNGVHDPDNSAIFSSSHGLPPD